MLTATDAEVYGTDGVWRKLHVSTILSTSAKRRLRCVECKGAIRAHNASKDGKHGAHIEHKVRWAGCKRCDAYDGGSPRLNPNPVL